MSIKDIKFDFSLAAARIANFADEVTALIIKEQTETEEKITEIANITNRTPEEVFDFYINHDYSLDYIKEAILAGNELSESGIMSYSLLVNSGELIDSLEEIILPEPTLKDKLIDILENVFFYPAYWLSYAILWIAFWIWDGIRQAYEDIWDD